MRIRNKSTESNEVPLGPLMDLVFLLLIFFIVIAVTKKSHKELGIVLPQVGTAFENVTPRDKDSVLRLTKDGDIYVGSTQVGNQGWMDEIRRAEQEKVHMRLEVDYRAQLKDLMPILEQIIHYGIKDWGIRMKYDES